MQFSQNKKSWRIHHGRPYRSLRQILSLWRRRAEFLDYMSHRVGRDLSKFAFSIACYSTTYSQLAWHLHERIRPMVLYHHAILHHHRNDFTGMFMSVFLGRRCIIMNANKCNMVSPDILLEPQQIQQRFTQLRWLQPLINVGVIILEL